jgi:hypothetical protein
MPPLSQHQSHQTVKMLLVGQSGSGKTGALVSLAEAGYNLFLADFDNGLDIVAKHASPEATSRISFVSYQDELKSAGGRPVPKKTVPDAFTRHLADMDKWPDDGKPLLARTPRDVFVLDSLTHQGMAALRYVLAINSRSGQHPFQSDWGDAMALQEQVLQLLYASAIKCHVIVISHVTFIEQDDKSVLGFPTALGSKLPPKVPTYFNTMVMALSRGSGASVRRVIKTTPEPGILTKIPVKVPAELPIETGLASIFEAMVGKPPAGVL